MATKRPQRLSTAIAVRFHPEALAEVKAAAEKIRLSDSDTIRKATQLGLPRLLQALGVSGKRPKSKAA